jgi:hypothetical protein
MATRLVSNWKTESAALVLKARSFVWLFPVTFTPLLGSLVPHTKLDLGMDSLCFMVRFTQRQCWCCLLPIITAIQPLILISLNLPSHQSQFSTLVRPFLILVATPPISYILSSPHHLQSFLPKSHLEFFNLKWTLWATNLLLIFYVLTTTSRLEKWLNSLLINSDKVLRF